MAIIPAKVTVDARKYWPQFFGGLLGNPATSTIVGTQWDPIIKTFKVGEGGWTNPGPVRRDPPEDDLRRLDNSIQDIDAIVDATRPVMSQRYTASTRASFEKALVLGDFTFETASTLRVRCFLDFSEFNDDGFGNPPEIWEIGLFSDHPTVSGQKLMVAYGTFPEEIKNVSKQIENIVRIVF